MRLLSIPLTFLVGVVLPACSTAPTSEGAIDDTAGATATATMASATPESTATATATEGSSSSPTAEPAFDEGEECENEELGYEVEYPADWWANELIDPDDDDPGFTPISACTYFAPEPVELQPNAGLPSGIAIQFGEAGEPSTNAADLLEEEATTVDGHDAVRIEERPPPSPGFIPEGSLIYRYAIELDDGRHLVASTDNILQDDAAYEESKGVLDAMMESIEIDD